MPIKPNCDFRSNRLAWRKCSVKKLAQQEILHLGLEIVDVSFKVHQSVDEVATGFFQALQIMLAWRLPRKQSTLLGVSGNLARHTRKRDAEVGLPNCINVVFGSNDRHAENLNAGSMICHLPGSPSGATTGTRPCAKMTAL